jgi:hypothetical protein
MGTLDFNKRYRNIAVDASRLVFKHEYIWGGYIGKEKYPAASTRIIDRRLRGQLAPVAGFDPAIGTSKRPSSAPTSSWGQGSCALHERCYWVIDLVRDQLTMPQQVDLVIMKHEEYDLFASVIEINGYQMGLKETVDKVVAEQGLSFNILPHHTTRNTKPDPELGVTSMKRMVANGQLHIPWGDQYSRTTMMQLVHELEEFPGRTTDTVMALWFAWKALQEQGPRYTSYNRLERPRMSYHAKGAGRRSVQNPAYAQRVREPHRPPDGDIRDTTISYDECIAIRDALRPRYEDYHASRAQSCGSSGTAATGKTSSKEQNNVSSIFRDITARSTRTSARTSSWSTTS